MNILEIRSVRFRVGAVVKERISGTRECELLAALDRLEASEAASGYRLFDLFDQVAADGLAALSSRQLHSIDQENGIYEFIARRLRVLFFKGASGKVVICTHLFMKKGQKTPDEEKNRAIKLQKRHDIEGADWIREL